MLNSQIQETIIDRPKTWVVTGVAGFIGSHLLEKLLLLGQTVIGLDNFSSGFMHNLDKVQQIVGPEAWQRFTLVQGDVTRLDDCSNLINSHGKIDHVLHQAALVSVPKSMLDPLSTHQTNVTGTLNIFECARRARVQSVVFASSSAVYGDDPAPQKTETMTGAPLSPYASSKAVCEAYATLYAQIYKMNIVGLRYFNVFGARQDPSSPYAAVIPKWIHKLAAKEQIEFYGDGSSTRDYCSVENIVKANLLAAISPLHKDDPHIFNVGTGLATTLSDLYHKIETAWHKASPTITVLKPKIGPVREGDIQHSCADITLAQKHLAFNPQDDFCASLDSLCQEHATSQNLAQQQCVKAG
jgi:UDP-N-acetylglucosamine/UDP-N-acetylgalactosamine 4-epimerase